MQDLMLRQPWTAALLIWVLAVMAPTGVGLLLGAVAPGWPEPVQRLAAEAVVVVLTVVLLTAARWWRRAGFVRVSEWRDIRLFWLPAVLVFLPLVFGVRPLDAGTLLV